MRWLQDLRCKLNICPKTFFASGFVYVYDDISGKEIYLDEYVHLRRCNNPHHREVESVCVPIEQSVIDFHLARSEREQNEIKKQEKRTEQITDHVG